MSLVKKEKFWLLTAVGFLCPTAYFLYTGNVEGVFATLVLGVCAWFFSIRTEIKNRLDTEGISVKRRTARRENSE